MFLRQSAGVTAAVCSTRKGDATLLTIILPECRLSPCRLILRWVGLLYPRWALRDVPPPPEPLTSDLGLHARLAAVPRGCL